MGKKSAKLDLQKDAQTILKHLTKCVRDFDPESHAGLGGPGKVKMIEVGYEFDQSGWLVVVLDTRPDAEPDGEWTSEIEGNELEMPHWIELLDANEEQPIELVQTDGQKSTLPAGSDLPTLVGEMIKGLLLQARADGLFEKLAKAEGCELGIEHFPGDYGWPEYAKRGEENLA